MSFAQECLSLNSYDETLTVARLLLVRLAISLTPEDLLYAYLGRLAIKRLTPVLAICFTPIDLLYDLPQKTGYSMNKLTQGDIAV